MSTKEEIKASVYSTISEQLGVAESEISSESSLINDLGADSLDVVELVMALEEKFEILEELVKLVPEWL